MGNEIQQTIKLKEVADVKEVLKGIDDIQKALGKLAIDPGTQASFNKLFDNIERQTEKANKAMSSGFKNKSDVKNYSDAMRQIISSYEGLIKNIETLKAKGTPLKDEGEIFKQLGTQIDELEKKYNKLQNTAAKAAEGFAATQQKVFNGMKAATSSPDFQEKQWKKLRDNFSEAYVDIDKAKEALISLRQAYDSANTDGRNADKWKLYLESLIAAEKHVKDYEQALEKKNNAESNAQVVYKDLTDAQALYNEAVGKGAVELNKAGDAAKTDAQNFRAYAKEADASAEQTQHLNSELEHFRSKAAYFFGLSNAINLFKRAVRSAYDTVKDLDAVMTETAVVTNFDVGDMWEQLPEYTQRANELGVSIHSAYEAATIFYQQGLKTNEVMAVSNETLKMARIAGLDAATASDRMTNALRGFNMEMDKMSAQRVNDVYSKLAAITASDTDEISTAMTKVASLAHNANMEFETTAAFLAQIIESTRESAETAGTALKTVVARFSEVKNLYSKGELLGQDEEGEEIDVNRVSTALRSAGINLNEYLTGAKGLDDIFMELAEKWDSLDIVQQRYIATMAAGSRQQSRFIALMSDYKRTVELVNAANNANGASNEQYGKTLESLETKLSRLKNAWNEFVLGLANSDAIKSAVDLLTDLITAINKLISAISGKNSGVKMITTFLTAFTTFKIGQKAVGSNSMLGGFFAKLVGSSETLAGKSGKEIAQIFSTSLVSKIADFSKSGGIDGAINKFKQSFSDKFYDMGLYFSPTLSQASQNKIMESIDWDAASNEQLENLMGTLGKGDITVEQINDALAKANQELRITKENAADFGITWKKNDKIIIDNTAALKKWSIAAIAIGGILTAIGDKLEQTEQWKDFGTILKGLGTGLMTFGTIMSVYIPLQAQLMAQGVTGAIVSIPIVGWIAGLISLLIALGVAIAGVVKNNSLETKLENATEDLKNATEAADEAREAYEKLGEAWNDLDDKYSAIENATKGTQEWRDAVREVNDAVLELANTYQNVEIYRDDEGILHISNKDEINEQASRNVSNTAAAQKGAKIRQVERQQDIDFAEMADNVFYYDFIKDLQDKGELEKLAGLSTEEIQDFANKRWGSTVEGGEVYNENEAKYVKEYVDKYLAQEKNISSQKAALGADILREVDFDESLNESVNNFLNDRYLNNLLKNGAKGLDDEDYDEIQRLYADAHGYDNYEKYKNDNPDDDTSEEGMKDFIAGARAVKDGSDQLKNFTNNFDDLYDIEKRLFENNLSRQDIISLSGYGTKNIEDVYNKLGGDATFGEGGLEVFTKWFEESLEIAKNSFDTSNFSEEFINNLDKNLKDNLNSGAFKSFTDNLWSVYQASGEEGMNAVQESISKMTKGMDKQQINKFVKEINDVNWSSVESIRTLDSLAEEFGISQDEMKAFENQIIELNKAAAQFDAEKLISVLGLANKIGSGEQGRSFTEKQYKELLDKGLSPDDFQFNIDTGNYDYIGEDIQDVRNAILQQTAVLREGLERTVASNEAIEKLQENGSPDIGDPKALRQFLYDYIDLAGDNALISRDAVGIANLSELQSQYNKIMQEYYNREDTQAQLDQANAYIYQTDSGKGNAAKAIEGDEQAAATLKQQLVNSGLSEEEQQKLLSEINNKPTTSWDYVKAVNNAGSVVDTLNEAKQYGIEAEDLNEYVEALKQVDDLQNANVATLYALALANARYQEGFKGVIESYDEWVQLKQEDGSIRAEEGNDVQEKAYTKLKKDLKEMFNLTENVSDEFLQSAENVELLEKAVHGDTEAVSKLRAQLAKSKLSLAIDNENFKNQAFDLIDDIVAEAGTLEFGATLNDAPMMQALQRILEEAGVTVTDMAKIFESFGWTPEITEKQIPFTSFQDLKTRGYQEVVDPITHDIVDMPTEGEDHYVQGGMITVPVFGGATFTPPEIPNATLPNPSSGGGGGGGGSEKKPSYWENPYDELYNLQEKINEALRTREALERRYQKLLKEEKATLADIRKAYYSQITNLRAEADLQKQFAAGRLRQINEVGNKLYTDEEGNRSSFNSLGVTRYASYDANTGLIQIDWNGLEAIANDASREEEGKAAEAYISKLEELVSSYEEVRDKLWEIEDKIEELREAAIESYLSFEDRVLEALVNSYQQQIDSYQAISNSLEKASNEVLTSLREQVELSRQIRDNTDKEKQIADMENRLAYLQRDTSGANALEIQKLQKDLEDARENYTDNLVDQAIEKMQNEADLAAEQRARQIETMQEQLEIMKDTGALWQQVYDLMDEAAAGDGALSPRSTLVELLKSTEAFESLSNIGQAKWWSEVAEEFHAAWVGRDEAEDKYKTDANNDGVIANSGTSAAINSVSATAASVSPAPTPASSGPSHDEATAAGVAMNICGPNNGWGNGDTRRARLEEKGFDYGTVQSIVNDIVNSGWNDSYYRRKYGISNLSDYSYYAFKTGGLADFTGPAWLDGTKAKPEIILNAQDSANFIALKDILASLLNVQSGGLNGTKSGDNYFDIDISANIGSDYDVDRLAERLKQNIYNDGQYRNVNTINFLR